MSKIGFLGCGNMASAFIEGITSRGSVLFSDICIHTRTKEKAQKYIDSGAVWFDTGAGLAAFCDILFVCVKPQQAEAVLSEISKCLKRESLVVTMLAGKTIGYFKSHLGKDAHVIRIMPNTPLIIGCGAVALSVDENVTDDELSTVIDMINLLGKVEIIPEEQMDTIVAVNGSSPAYFYLFVKLIAEWAQNHGVDYDSALNLAVYSMLGSSKMLQISKKSPDELIKAVTSPGGTTLAALASFDNDDIKGVISRALDTCKNRSQELSAV